MFRTNPAFLLFISLLLVVAVAGCGSGNQTTPPNSSGFTNANFSGTYSFAYSGSNTGGFFAVTGSLVADGNGNITSGVEDFNSPGLGGVATGVAISGAYSVRTDGRTVATINAPSLTSPLNKFVVTFVLLSPQKALIIQFDSNATGSGTIDQQSSAAFNLAALAGALAFSVSGVDGVGNPEDSVGLVNTDNAGNITSGTVDANENFVSANAPLSASTIAAPSTSTGRGTLTIASGLGTFNFAYYIVDGNHLKLVEIDGGGPFMAGDAFRQTSAAVSGSFAFTQVGSTTSGHGVFLFGAILNTDGAGNVLPTSVEDIDNGGSTTVAGGASVQGTYTISAGRGTMHLTGAETLNLVFYPSTAGLLMLDVDSTVVASGTAILQTGAPFSNGSINNGYGMNFTSILGPGTVSQSELDAIAQFNANGSGSLTGAMDVNNSGATSSSLALSGSYTVNSNGRGTAQLKTSQTTFNLIFYMGSNSQVQFIELDETLGQLSVGNFQAQ